MGRSRRMGGLRPVLAGGKFVWMVGLGELPLAKTVKRCHIGMVAKPWRNAGESLA